MAAHGNLPVPMLRSIRPAPIGYVQVLLGPGRQMRVPERAVRRWTAEPDAVVVEVDPQGPERLAPQRQAAFMRFARALLQAADVPDVPARLADLAATLRGR